MHVAMPASLDREAIELNKASADALPMTFVDYAEMVWRKAKEGATQQAIADELGWSRSTVADFNALRKIGADAWAVVAASASGDMSLEDTAATSVVAAATFTEFLLREIVPLTAEQQLELVRDLADGKINKNKFKSLAASYRARRPPS